MNQPNHWNTNPLVTNIRNQIEYVALGAQHETLRRDIVSISHFDIMLQTMRASCSYEPQEIWRGSGGLVDEIVSKVEGGEVAEATVQMEVARQGGDLLLNTNLLYDIMNGQILYLKNLAEKEYDGEPLPLTHRTTFTRTDAQRKLGWANEAAGYDPNDVKMAVAENGLFSPEHILYSIVPGRVSRAIAEARHYIHCYREDEIAAFGAFKPFQKYPFAWVSYSPIGRQYKRDMLAHAGADPANSLELTRAWQTEHVPRNVLSMLYGFANKKMRELWRVTRGQDLEAVITGVDPNLGFTGSSFFAVNFEQVGVKATRYAFVEDESWGRHYVTRRQADTQQESGNAPQLLPSRFPLLDTQELVVRFNNRGRKLPVMPLMRYADTEYEKAA